ncbi:unnamed protein product [Fusarium graminearum]|uniref:Methyltransferase type 11 domain-containing protein n=1 Tax=Gibberella zeae (strain ATCC MYA-4620 / CBS 123657 / FGSC 9075 / NRRL 31084 / PH-1) TaxID=229533 RepID=I1RDB6_GIBZE|nr:hypothetical protein FGSG_01610 [Fusarium graminearum PH-1]ESU06948.1 hypothetical protein FGSG_01610 [Fusarium graminearum PH-1]EYB22673.1 hypothetical protein FG05_01610 [Fusarium graminearum]CZS77040.1 unnamed protein product [Fusarium graminearum]|eukprot:XP_011317433.1 hypothetical protein FGSG_01610 [Fusarium graminearum PH-1]
MTSQQDTPTALTPTASTSRTSTIITPAQSDSASVSASVAAAPSSPTPQAELIPAEDPGDNVDHDTFDVDSALGSDAASYLYPESIAASILEYRTIQGRTYHSDRHAADYFTPNDEQQLQDFADTYPSAQVVGSDLSPCQPEWVPPNVRFEIADATLEWPWKDDYFDFVHIRYLFGAIQDWPALFREAYRCCAPGGWVQSCEADIHFYSDDGTTDSEPALKTWNDLYESGGIETGRPFFLQREAIQERSITEAGFTDVRIFDYKLPVGGWTNNRKLAETGEYVRLTLENDLEGYTFYLWHHVLNWCREEYTQFLASMLKALANRRVHGYMMVRYVYARKP